MVRQQQNKSPATTKQQSVNIKAMICEPIVPPTMSAAQKCLLGKPLGTISAVQMDFVQIAFQPPHPQATGPFGATFFAEN